MSTVEDRVHRAMSAASGLIDSVPPLRLTPAPRDRRHTRRHGRAQRGASRQRALRWAAPLAAAAVIVTLAISLVTLRNTPNGPVTSPNTQTLFPSGVPRYYAAIVPPKNLAPRPDRVQIRETLTGKLVATVKPPAGATFVGVTGAADDLTWVLDTKPGILGPGESENPAYDPRTWYLLRLSPGSPSRASLSRLPIPPTPAGASVSGIALSPDGTRLAVTIEQPGQLEQPGQALSRKVTLRVYSVRTGAVLRSWSATAIIVAGLTSGGNLSLAWLDDGRSLAFGVLTVKRGETRDGPVAAWPAITAKIRVMPVDTPDSAGLLSARAEFSLENPPPTGPFALGCLPGNYQLLFTADGRLICGGAGRTRIPLIRRRMCATGPAWFRIGLLEYTPSNGAASRTPVRVLQQHTLACGGPLATVYPLWTDPSGRTQLGFQGLREHGAVTPPAFGMFRNGKFTPLPFLPASAVKGTVGNGLFGYIAW